MSVNYYIICHDCKKWADMQNFYIESYLGPGTPPWSQKKSASMKVDELDKLCQDWAWWLGRVTGFVLSHNGHKIGIYNEHDVERVEDPRSEEDEDDDIMINGFSEELKFSKHCLEPFVESNNESKD